MTDQTLPPDTDPLAALTRRITALEQAVAAGHRPQDENAADQPPRFQTLQTEARDRVQGAARASRLPVWAIVVIVLLGLYGAIELLDDLHLF